jgi:poly-gamma-glutamate synthesis protein (capsule biosynthesis protein)
LTALFALLVAGCTHSITLTCTGDVMLGRGVARVCAEKGPDYPFAPVAPLLREADLTFGNLESPLTDLPTRFPRVNALRGSPEMAGALRRAGFDVMSLANNHAIDYGRPGLAQTVQVLQRAGITPVGAGATLAEAEQGAVVAVRGVPVGFLAFSNFPYVDFVRDPARESIAMLSEEALRRTVPGMARRCSILVVSFHWGREGSRVVSAEERHLAHLAVDLGADLVVGHHAHVRGEIEQYRGRLIVYCLGNLVFDQDSYGGNEGYILQCRYEDGGKLIDRSAVAVRVEKGQARVDGP